jgi:hypothetical protein
MSYFIILFVVLITILIISALINFYHGGKSVVLSPMEFEEEYVTNLMAFKNNGNRIHLINIIDAYRAYKITSYRADSETYNKNKSRVDIIKSGLKSVDVEYDICMKYLESNNSLRRIKIELRQYNFKMFLTNYKLGKFNISDKLESLLIDNTDDICKQHIINLKTAINNFNTSLID